MVRLPHRSPTTRTPSLNGRAEHLVHPLNVYTACPDLTAKEIKALAAAQEHWTPLGPDVTGFMTDLPIPQWHLH